MAGVSRSAYPHSASSLASDFELLRVIGRGRFGEVSLARHTRTGFLFALKRTSFGKRGQPDANKVKVEASALSRLSHPNVIRYYSTFTEGGDVSIAMEFADGGDLAQLLEGRWAALPAGAAGLPEDEVMGWFVQLAAGLSHVHQHRVCTPIEKTVVGS